LFRAVRAGIEGRFADAEALSASVRAAVERARDPLGERTLAMVHEGLLRAAERHDEMRAHDVVARRQRAVLHLAPSWQALGSAILYTRLEDQAQARHHL